jgi:5-(aminomethyl)-3-furanmethanol phosphate kinase
VPGGGLFADAVRTAQRQAGLDDGLAHRLAIDAMSQMGAVFAALEPALVPVARADEWPALWGSGRVPLWDARELKGGHPAIAESWNVTSDSLALHLATRLEAEALVLVKPADAPEDVSLPELARLGLVDAAFPTMADAFRGSIALIGPAADGRLAEALRPVHGRAA